MSSPVTFYRLLFVLGVYAQVAQALLIREILVVFYGNEISLGAFFGSWLGGMALGAAMPMWFRVRQPERLLSWLVPALPLLLAGQMIAMRLVRQTLEVSAAEFLPLGDLFAAIALLTLPTAVVLGVVFPLACRIFTDSTAVAGMSRLYVFDALGALAGGALFTFVLVEHFGVWAALGTTALVLFAFSGLSALWNSRILKFVTPLLILAALALAVTPVGQWAERYFEQLRFATLQPGLELLDTVETRYGHTAVARLGEQVSVVTDGRVTHSFPQTDTARQEAAYFVSQSASQDHVSLRVLLFGSAASELPAEVLRYPVARLEMVEPDARAFQRIRPYFTLAMREALADPRVTLHFGDGRRFVRQPAAQGYDLILALDASPTNAHGNRYFTLEFYRHIRALLSPRGVFCTQVSSASNYLGSSVQSYTASVWHTLRAVLPHAALRPGDHHVYCASPAAGQVSDDAAELARRYQKLVPLCSPDEAQRNPGRPGFRCASSGLPSTQRDEPTDSTASQRLESVPTQTFHALLPPDRVAYARSRLQEAPEALNSDTRPVTYYLNMLLWGKFSASHFTTWLENLRRLGPWPYLVPLALLTLLMMLRATLHGTPHCQRQAAALALTVLGLVAMAVQLTLLFSFQAQVGVMFGYIALLNGLFMSGLALGAGLTGQFLARSRHAALLLAVLLGGIGVALSGLPALLTHLATLDGGWQENAYLLLTFITGLITGSGFPLGVRLAHHGDSVQTGGLAQLADNLGGALGGLLTGTVLVPVLGISLTCYLLAGMAGLAVLPVWYARYTAEGISALQVRGKPSHPPLPNPPPLGGEGTGSLPFNRLSWLLIFIVLCAGWLHWALADNRAAFTVHVEERRLAAVTGISGPFSLHTDPFPHYRAPGPAVALASIPVAGGVQGYAGPLNLLVAVDAKGKLRGAQHIESAESVDYIAGIDSWLQGLRGHDFQRAPLSLDHIDALSGATITSRAALATINRTARAASQSVFGTPFPAQSTVAWSGGDWLKLAVLVGVLLLFVPVYFRGGERARLAYQALVLGVLGLWLNVLASEVDLLNLAAGQWPDWHGKPLHALVLGFVLLSMLLLGQAYCGYVCPFGAAQEFLSRLGRRLGLRRYGDQRLDRHLRYVKFLLLALLLLAVWTSGDRTWAVFNPMQHLFGGRLSGWLWGIVLVSLGGALFYYRFWCRYLCPFGAFAALGNKLALLQRRAPQRVFKHCDLGVRDEFDVDCIRCHRCLTAVDTGRVVHR